MVVQPTITVKIWLDPEGFQCRIENWTTATSDGSGVTTTDVCRDFAMNHDSHTLAAFLQDALHEEIKRLMRSLNK
jgi:hypothetical protein